MIYIVGSGPGDPELITVKGMNLLKKADVVLYTGSTVSKEVLIWCKNNSLKVDSASLTLEEIIDILVNNHNKNKIIVRLHSGDPTVYGAIEEEIKLLLERDIKVKVIPGVGAHVAFAAELGIEMTLPEVVQSILITRLSGRTKVPEDLDVLLSQQPTTAIYLSSTMQEEVLKLLKKYYPKDSILYVGHKITRKEQKIEFKKLSEWEKIDFPNSLSLFLIRKNGEKRSKLYDPNFTHRDRR
ncbi:precorrin-4 C(11)-methyltransferase [Tepiditoga spiralis]|uniref:Precorrin-4 C(11)-methyltransferase n=1 Tax=Tepiditoga spiralis TaxID=2108365 RepID=A0A7G1GC19_9BACT|nr:cobalt-precorrin-4/precorrin-4 C(11)-methyltransferase [Tepiditoga spiralis]BBE31619.1 precorrin-4 C(11)-methyltransferase [Tepiditoga spiralis]